MKNPLKTFAFHNLVAHPLSEILWWLGLVFKPCRRWSGLLHDRTLPKHHPDEGRG